MSGSRRRERVKQDADSRETPAEHFKKCGPFCSHVTFCEECSEVHGTCSAHREIPSRGVVWAKPNE